MKQIISFVPNALSCLRIVLIGPFIYALLNEDYTWAFYIFVIAGLSDGIDGYLARKFNCMSYFGSFMDPLADKILLITSFVALAYLGKLPLWLMWAVIARDLIIMLGVAGLYSVFGRVEFEPSKISKYNTAVQVIFIFLLLFGLAFGTLPETLINSVQWLVLFTTLLSLFTYLWFWGRKAYRDWKNIART